MSSRLSAARRPHYLPHERHAILTLRAAAGWSAAQTARVFLLTPPTIADWGKALQDDSRGTLVTVAVPVNRFPDYVRLLVQQLAVTFPAMGRRRIADTLCRGGLHLSPSTVRRVVTNDAPLPTYDPRSSPVDEHGRTGKHPAESTRTVTARYAHHVWNADITPVPTFQGFWVPWLPHAVTPSASTAASPWSSASSAP